MPHHALMAAENWYFGVISAELVVFIQRILCVLLLFLLNKHYLSGGNL